VKVYLGTYSLMSKTNDGMDLDHATIGEKLLTIRDLGYDGAELLIEDLEENRIETLKEAFRNAQILCSSAHIKMSRMEEMMPILAELGAKYIITGGENMLCRDDALRVADELNRLGTVAQRYGLRVGYHNHDHEFTRVGLKSIEEYLIDNTDPGSVVFQLDCGWAAAAGIWAPAFIERYSGRFAAIHVKENDKVYGTRKLLPMIWPIPDDLPVEKKKALEDNLAYSAKIMTSQGAMGSEKSNINWFKMKEALDAQGIGEILWVVEREHTYAGTRADCLRADCAWLKANL